MRVYLPFIERLDLAPDADERQVRRAYARELKKIDQEADLEGFQELRACYEAALEWVAQRDAGAAADDDEDRPDAAPAVPAVAALVVPAAAVPPAPPAPEGAGRPQPQAAPRPQLPSPEALGAAVFADFQAQCAVLAGRPDPGGSNDAVRAAPWTVALEQALADPRLLNLDARMIFEGRIAALLADGWKPGHHLLLVAANAVFGWSRDRHALERLGYPGAVLDAALGQREMFQDQPHEERMAQRNLMALMRAGEEPDTPTVIQYRRALAILETHFPAMLTVGAPRTAIVMWRKLRAALPPETAHQAPAKPRRRWPYSRRDTGIFVWFALAIVIAFFMQDKSASQRTAERIDYHGSAGPRPIPENHPVLGARIAQIRGHIDYKPGPDALPGQQLADIRVTLDADGKVVDMQAEVTGAESAFVAAVERAIEASGPFPPGSPSSFVLEFSSENGAAARPRTGQHAPAGVARQPLPKALMDKIEGHVDYHPGKNVLPGEQRVMLKVRLDWQGEVFGIEKIEATGDPAFAAAIERAVRRSGPFPPETPRMFSIGYRMTLSYRPAKKTPKPEAPPRWPAAPSSPPAAHGADEDTIVRDPSQLRLRAPAASAGAMPDSGT